MNLRREELRLEMFHSLCQLDFIETIVHGIAFCNVLKT
jgi:hypothetical protein